MEITSEWSREFTSIDTETTGTRPEDRVIEIAMVKFARTEGNDYDVVEQWSTLVNPGEIDLQDPTVAEAMNVNQIDPQRLVDAPTFGQLFGAIRDRWPRVAVGHNFDFDYRMIRQDFLRLGADPPSYPMLRVDTMLSDFGMRPGKRKRRLSAACERWQVSYEPTHRAVADAIACGHLAIKMFELLPDDPDRLVYKMERWRKEWKELWGKRQ